jgi:hypothetical protein
MAAEETTPEFKPALEEHAAAYNNLAAARADELGLTGARDKR